MASEDKLFFEVISASEQAGVLDSLMLVGGWCQKNIPEFLWKSASQINL